MGLGEVAPIRAFTLEVDELAALCGFLSGKRLLGLDEALFCGLSEESLPRLMTKLSEHRWIEKADRPGSWHFNEDLMLALTVAVAPHFAMLVRSLARRKSIVFYMAEEAITEVVLSGDRVVIVKIDRREEMISQVMEFLRDSLPGEVVVARVSRSFDGFEAGCRLAAETSVWSRETADVFIRHAMTKLGAKFIG